MKLWPGTKVHLIRKRAVGKVDYDDILYCEANVDVKVVTAGDVPHPRPREKYG